MIKSKYLESLIDALTVLPGVGRKSAQRMAFELLNANPDLQPIDPQIHISGLEQPNGETEIEWDVRDCKSFSKDQGRWMRLRPGQKVPT